MVKYFPLISLCFLGLIYFTGGTYLWPGFVLLVAQVISLSLTLWVIKIFRNRDLISLIPIMNQFKYYFALVFTGWIGMAFTGHIAELIGRIYGLVAVIIFIALAVVAINQIYIERNLLSEYRKNKNCNFKKGEDQKHDR